MINENLLWEINKNLEEISAKLDRLITLFELVQRRRLEEIKERILGRSEITKEIYGLCDGTRTVQDIAKRVQISLPNISGILKKLVEAGLIKVRKVGRKRYYERII